MFNSKTKFSLISSALAVIATSAIAIACTSQEDIPESSASIVENNTMLNDTILIETDAPLIQKSNMGSVSVKTYNLIQSLSGSTTRSDATPEVYYLYDDMTEKVCEALAVPSGGASLLVGLGFTVASTYVCD